MKQKIEWYREVLELEPGSRVFFPLARLLAGDGQTHDAIITLRQGVLRHPDHVEARLLLVELLSAQGSTSDLTAEVERLGALFAGYPGFWKAWSKELATNPAMQDAALAIRFFAAALQGQSLTWASIIEHGLQSLLHNAEPLVESFSARPTMREIVPDHVSDFVTPTVVAVQEQDEIDAEDPDMAFDEPHVAMPEEMDEEDAEEAFSLRTRSMAEVLAEQGDVAGALDIYRELIAAAPEGDRASLEARAEELSRRMTTNVSAQEPVGEKGEGTAKDGNRLIGLLESLAERLEARAR